LGAVVAASLEARWVGAGVFASCLGLIAPMALAVGVGVALARLVFAGGASFAPLALLRSLNARTGASRTAWLGVPPVAALFGLLGLVMLSGVAARLFAADVSGVASFGWVGLALFPLLFSAAAAVRTLSSALGPRLDEVGAHPRAVLLASLAGFGVGLTLLVALGETSGGGGPMRILGVLRRQELDLRAPGLLLLVAAGAALMPTPRRALTAALAAALAASPLWLTLVAGRALGDDAALAIERRAPLGRISLALLRQATDRDRDGVSAAFAGGDCDDRDPRVSPRATDVPGNGKDEDCSGSDEAPAEPRAPAMAVASGHAAADLLPDDLNVVLVTIDTLRADLGYMGNPRTLSPNLDALAAKSVVFERAYSLASYTGKSMGPLLIGKYSSELEGGFLHFNRYGKRETFVQERLRTAGVYTASVQGYWYFFKDAGFERGFDVIDSSAAPKVVAIEGDQSSNSDEQSDAAIKLLAAPELAGRRFFLWMHFVDPHAEYAPHAEHDFGPKPRDRYDGEVAFVDHHLGRFLAALEQAPFGARTAVVVTSDHGEAFGEHGMIRHGFELWEELVRVPLIVKVPGVAPRRVTARRSAIDVVPTLLDLFKVELRPRADNDFLSGESLMPDVLRPAGETAPERPIFIDMARGPHNAERRALIEGDQKLTVSEGRVLGLYDLDRDPGEKEDLARDKARVTAMRDKLKAFTRRLRPVPMPPP
jgi:choline-sulfatase